MLRSFCMFHNLCEFLHTASLLHTENSGFVQVMYYFDYCSSSAPLQWRPREPWGGRCDTDVLSRAEHSSVSCSLHMGQLWFFVLIGIYCKKFLWWALRDALIYGKSNVIRSPFITMAISSSLFGPMYSIGTNFWPVNGSRYCRTVETIWGGLINTIDPAQIPVLTRQAQYRLAYLIVLSLI